MVDFQGKCKYHIAVPMDPSWAKESSGKKIITSRLAKRVVVFNLVKITLKKNYASENGKCFLPNVGEKNH